MKRLKPLFFVMIAITFMGFLYGTIALLLTYFPKSHPSTDEKNATIYLYHNAMHSDIILDIRMARLDWDKILPEIIRGRQRGYLAFGWGDRETYLSTPEWEQIATSTALKALFTNTPSLIHASFYTQIRKGDVDVKTIKLTPQQLHGLEESLRRTFGRRPTYLSMGYGPNDAFYDSEATYNLIQTCNTWTGDRFREANITMSYWTPLSYNVVHSLE
ncbi:MAG TPA: DUF2459 domain-containing protein [Campylobacterales bacterium]|nr:DUF2459 domain-containing protein [Campylobacterales bacterium]